MHHRVPSKSLLHNMTSLCLGCHATVHRTRAVLSEVPAPLLTLWREQHPRRHEQNHLDFNRRGPAAVPVSLFEGDPAAG